MIPTAYGRDGDRLLLHGAAANHVLKAAAGGAELTVTVTLIDGLVLARSTFHHSINYRSVVVFGRATAHRRTPRRRPAALARVVDHIVPGRTGDARAPEPGGTGEHPGGVAAAWTRCRPRCGPADPIDDEEDLGLPVWAGVLPLAAGGRGAPTGGAARPARPAGLTSQPGRWWTVHAHGYLHRPGRLGDRHAPRRVVPDHRRVSDRGTGAGPGRDRKPDVGAGPAGGARGARRGARSIWPAWPSPTSISTMPAGSATWPGRFPGPPCTSTRRAPATWSTRTAWSARPARSTATSWTRSTAASTPTPAERLHVLADGETIEIGPGRTPDHGRLARARQAPSGLARQRERHPVRR